MQCFLRKFSIFLIFGFGDDVTEILPPAGYNKDTKKNKEDLHMSAVNISKKNFQEEVLNSDKKVLLDFWAPWCGPCRSVLPIVEEIAEEYDDIKVCKINVDEEIELASQYRVMSIPTLVVMEKGQEVKRASGARSKGSILAML